jgi:aryl-alcohol dehydrogenase-like predicted oxidoreductase
VIRHYGQRRAERRRPEAPRTGSRQRQNQSAPGYGGRLPRCSESAIALRFSPEARQANQPVIDRLSRLAAARNATPAQIALAWLLAQLPWIVPIPGTRRLERLEENLAACAVELTSTDLQELAEIGSTVPVPGARGTGRETYG